MNDLYYPPKLSKLEEYQQKLKERELYTNSIVDTFIENGAGAPKHDKNGNLMTKRRNLLNEDFDNLINNTNIKSPSVQIQNNSNNNNSLNNNNTNLNPRLYQSFNNRKTNINLNNNQNNSNQNFNNNNDNNTFNRRYSNKNIMNNNNLLNTLEQKDLNNLNQNFNRSSPYNKKSNNNNIPNREGINNEDINKNNNINISNKNQKKNKKNDLDDNIFDDDYKGLGILPRRSEDNKIRQYREEALKAELKREIEERKLKKEMEKQIEREKDLKEDLKVQKALEEERALLKLEKLKKEEIEAQINMANMIKSQKNKKKKQLIDLDEYYGKDIKFSKRNISKDNDDNANTNNQNQNQDINNNNNENISDENNNEYSNNNNINANINDNINNNMINRINNYKINSVQNLKKIRQETIDDINNFTIKVEKRNENLDKEISQLRNEVRSQYLEMNDLFKQLKFNVNEAEQYKNGINRESKIIKEELLKNRMASVLNKNLRERNYEDNMNVNYDELINKNINTIDSNTNLEGTSNFVYFEKEDNNNNDHNLDNNNKMSSLAMAGKNVIELTGENELIPINNNNTNNYDMKEMDINKIDIMNEERKNEDENDKKGIIRFKQQMEREKLLYNDFDNPCTMDDLYKELNIIENINQTLSPINKIETLKNNFNVDYGDLRNKEKHKIKSKFIK